MPKLYDFEVRNRWTNAVRFTARIEADPSVPYGVRLGFAVRWGFANGADLTGANLTGADLTGADLTGANLTGADLAGADLTGADLTGADLTRADLTRAEIHGEAVARLIASAQRLIDPYSFLAFELAAGGYKIAAGCRWFTDDEFRAHVAIKYPGTDKAAETLSLLDFISGRASALGVKPEAEAA